MEGTEDDMRLKYAWPLRPVYVEWSVKNFSSEALALLTGEPLSEVSQIWDLHIIRGTN